MAYRPSISKLETNWKKQADTKLAQLLHVLPKSPLALHGINCGTWLYTMVHKAPPPYKLSTKLSPGPVLDTEKLCPSSLECYHLEHFVTCLSPKFVSTDFVVELLFSDMLNISI